MPDHVAKLNIIQKSTSLKKNSYSSRVSDRVIAPYVYADLFVGFNTDPRRRELGPAISNAMAMAAHAAKVEIFDVKEVFSEANMRKQEEKDRKHEEVHKRKEEKKKEVEKRKEIQLEKRVAKELEKMGKEKDRKEKKKKNEKKKGASETFSREKISGKKRKASETERDLCVVCGKSADEISGGIEWVACDVCDLWVMEGCDTKAKESLEDDSDYICPNCDNKNNKK